MIKPSKLLGAVLLCGSLAIGPVLGQARSSGTTNGINYVVIGGGSQSISAQEGGLEVISDGVRIDVLSDEILVDGTRYAVAAFDDILIDQTGGGLLISVDGREVVSVSVADALNDRAKTGDLDAMNELAILLFQGDDIDLDLERAERLLRTAAEGGNAPAQTNLASRLRFGSGLAEDHDEAFIWAQQAADQGRVYAQYLLGDMLVFGLGTPVDAPRGLEYLESALAQGEPDAAVTLGYIYNEGIEVPADQARAVAYNQQGVEMGDRFAAFNLAVIAVQTAGDLVSAEDGLAYLDQAIAMGWTDDTASLRDDLIALQNLPEARFFYADGDTPVGPFTADQLRVFIGNNTITPQTLAWEGGTDEWRQASDVLAPHN